MGRMFAKSGYQQLKSDNETKNAKTVYQKVIFFGPSGSGKTRIARALSGDLGTTQTEPTIGGSYFEDNTDKKVRLQLWDVGGSKRFEPYWHLYLRGSQQVVLTFDTEDKKSFAALSHYCDKIHRFAPDANIVLVGVQNTASVIDERAIQLFMGKHAIQHYYHVNPSNSEEIKTLHDHIVAQAEPKPIPEADAVIQAKELAKDSIDLLRGLALNETDQNSEIIRSICNILENALLSENLSSYFDCNASLLEDHLEQLRYARSSLYSTACNTVTAVLVCCAILTTGFVALYWLNKVFKENYEQKGHSLLFSTSGAKQLAQEAMHKTSQSMSPRKR